MKIFNELKNCRYGKMIYNKKDMYVGKSLDLYGEFSEGEVVLFKQIVHKGMVVLEIGANIAAHTVLLSQLVGENGVVIAFEPQRLVFQILAGNIAINGIFNVFCYQKAVGEASGNLLVPVLNSEEETNWGGLELGQWNEGEVVEVICIDDLQFHACHFMKVDVEGMELKVIKGARGTIEKFRPIMYIENDRKEKSVELIKYVAALEYDMYWHTPFLYNPNNFFGNKNNVFGNIASHNMLCIPSIINAKVDGLEKVLVPE
jgi:FkbM family methyltransferase